MKNIESDPLVICCIEKQMRTECKDIVGENVFVKITSWYLVKQKIKTRCLGAVAEILKALPDIWRDY